MWLYTTIFSGQYTGSKGNGSYLALSDGRPWQNGATLKLG